MLGPAPSPSHITPARALPAHLTAASPPSPAALPQGSFWIDFIAVLPTIIYIIAIAGEAPRAAPPEPHLLRLPSPCCQC